MIVSLDEMAPAGSTPEEINAWSKRNFYRREIANQQARWKEADYVFLAEARSLRRVGDYRIDTILRPIVDLKAAVGSRPIRDTYDPEFGNTCGATSYPDIGQTAIFYAVKRPWWSRILNWGQPDVIEAVPLREVADPQIPVELRAAVARLRKTESK